MIISNLSIKKHYIASTREARCSLIFVRAEMLISNIDVKLETLLDFYK